MYEMYSTVRVLYSAWNMDTLKPIRTILLRSTSLRTEYLLWAETEWICFEFVT
jgi:hypothetical protein